VKKGVRGYDGGKKIKGRRGLVLKVKVLPAQITDAEGGKVLLQAAGATQRDCCHLWLQTPVRGVGQDHLGLERPDANLCGIWWPKDKPIPDGLAEDRRVSQLCGYPQEWSALLLG
jgi:hypothetical protein